jgi:hypothetical protein
MIFNVFAKIGFIAGRGYVVAVDLMDNPQGQGYPQAPQPLGQHYVLPTYRTTPAAANNFSYFQRSKNKSKQEVQSTLYKAKKMS